MTIKMPTRRRSVLALVTRPVFIIDLLMEDQVLLRLYA